MTLTKILKINNKTNGKHRHHLEGQRWAENARMRTRRRTLYGRVAVAYKKAHKKKTGNKPVFYLKLIN